MRLVLEKLFSGVILSKSEAQSFFSQILDSTTSPLQVASALTAYRMRPLSLNELDGFREVALSQCRRIDLSEFQTIDVCGTGGDDKGTFNISTITAVVLAACGLKVAKHGGGAVSSKVGSSNLLEALGYKFTDDEATLKRQIDKTGVCFLHAPLFHPSFKNVAGVRKELGFKTIFNVLGPLVNPSNPNCQIIGVYSLDLMQLYSQLARRLKKNYAVVHTLDGCDEVSLTTDVKISAPAGENIFRTKDFGLPKNTYEDLREGGGLEDAAKIFHNVLDGNASSAQTNAVIANSALALFYHCKFLTKDIALSECVETANEAIKSGKAKRVFQQLLDI